jgi:hypothetical protein
MSFAKADIKPQQTYRTRFGKLIYIQDISGQKATFCEVGSTERREASLGRLADHIAREVPNQ